MKNHCYKSTWIVFVSRRAATLQENLPKSTAHQFLYLNLFSPSGQSMNEDQTLHISFFITEPAPSYSVLKPCLCLGQQSLTLCIKTSSAVHASCICPLMYFRVKAIFCFGFLCLASSSSESTSSIYFFMPYISPYSLLYCVVAFHRKSFLMSIFAKTPGAP